MRNLPIGLFDSGMGGLTVLRAMRELLPGESFIYLGDTARLPYGTKSRDTVIRYAGQASSKLVEQDVKMLVVACNTVSAVALPSLEAAFSPLPVVGVVEPGAQAACAASQSGQIAVIATESTIRGRAYEQAILRLRPEARVIGKACPLFVGMAEDGLVEGELAEGLAARYLDGIFKANRDSTEPPDCLVLGCTHYPVLRSAIAKVTGSKVNLVDSAQTTALAVRRLLDERDLHAEGQSVSIRYLTTDDAGRFAQLGGLFLGEELDPDQVELVDL